MLKYIWHMQRGYTIFLSQLFSFSQSVDLHMKAARSVSWRHFPRCVFLSDMAATLCVKLLPKQGNVVPIIL